MTIPVPVEPLVGVLDRSEPGGGQPQIRSLAIGIEVVSRRVPFDDFAEDRGRPGGLQRGERLLDLGWSISSIVR